MHQSGASMTRRPKSPSRRVTADESAPLLRDDQIFTNFGTQNPAVRTKVIAMRPFESSDVRFVAPQKFLENFPVRVTVRTVRQHYLGVAIQPKQAVKGIDGCFARPEGRMWLFDLLHFSVLHDANAAPVA